MAEHTKWIVTFSNVIFHPLDPNPETILIEDIAHALSLLCRYNGHCLRFYSVAEHCVRVSMEVPPEDRLAALLHDASEAYLADIPRPLKRDPSMIPYRTAENNLQRMINKRFGLPEEMPASVHEADERMLFTERRDIVRPGGPDWGWSREPYPETIEGWQPHIAEGLFRLFFDRYTAQRTP